MHIAAEGCKYDLLKLLARRANLDTAKARKRGSYVATIVVVFGARGVVVVVGVPDFSPSFVFGLANLQLNV